MAKKNGQKDRFYRECKSEFDRCGCFEAANTEYQLLVEKSVDNFEKKHKVGKYATD